MPGNRADDSALMVPNSPSVYGQTVEPSEDVGEILERLLAVRFVAGLRGRFRVFRLMRRITVGGVNIHDELKEPECVGDQVRSEKSKVDVVVNRSDLYLV